MQLMLNVIFCSIEKHAKSPNNSHVMQNDALYQAISHQETEIMKVWWFFS